MTRALGTTPFVYGLKAKATPSNVRRERQCGFDPYNSVDASVLRGQVISKTALLDAQILEREAILAKLLGSDFAAIEARVVGVLADELQS